MNKLSVEAFDKILDILRINTATFNTPTKLATAYLDFKRDLQDLFEKTRNEGLGAHIEKKQEMLSKYRDFVLIFRNLENEIHRAGFAEETKHLSCQDNEEVLKQLPQASSKQLLDNYTQDFVKSIIDAINDFARFVYLFSGADELLSRITDDGKTLSKQRSLVVRAAEVILKNATLDEESRRLIERLKAQHVRNPIDFQIEKIDPICISLLYKGALEGPQNPCNEDDYAEWFEEYVSLVAAMGFTRPQGQQQDIFFKAIQIIIYKLLTETPPAKHKRYAEWAKGLTARIINESYSGKGLRKLSAKDVDNSLIHTNPS
jgi:hypothetical protein